MMFQASTGLLLVFFWLPQGSCFDVPACTIRDNNKPPLLNSYGGDERNYKFQCQADVDKITASKFEKYQYRHLIQNQQSTVLWADWLDVDIQFQQIDPSDCARKCRESTLEWLENPKSIVRYGLGKIPGEASAYIVKNQAKSFPLANFPPSLSASSYGKIEYKNKPIGVNIAFETSVSSEGFIYWIDNRGAEELVFSIPTLTSRWAGYKILENAIRTSNWSVFKAGSDLFLLKPKYSAKLFLRILPEIKSFSEETGQIIAPLGI